VHVFVASRKITWPRHLADVSRGEDSASVLKEEMQKPGLGGAELRGSTADRSYFTDEVQLNETGSRNRTADAGIMGGFTSPHPELRFNPVSQGFDCDRGRDHIICPAAENANNG